jgi:MinD superfamily P-loop ATPase
MAVKISVASGKGGTGKTSVAVYLFRSIAENWTPNVRLMDCDVEEPNDHIFFPGAKENSQREVTRKIPVIDKATCTFCRACVEYCEFNAIVVIPPAEFASVSVELCHSCGACLKACKFGAITETDETIGTIRSIDTPFGLELMQGELRVGSAMQTMVIKELLKTSDDKPEVVLIDAPPGTSCPVVSSVKDSDYIILVTEPTPFGLNDLKLTLEMLAELNKDIGVIINKDGLGSNEMEKFLENENIEILAKIPFSREFASRYAEGRILEEIPHELEEVYFSLVEKLKEKLN